MRFRIITDGYDYKVQTKSWYSFWWSTVQRPENLDEKDFGGDKSFASYKDAKDYIERETPRRWRPA